MKKTLLLFIAMMLTPLWVQADSQKDLIYTANDEVIEATILEVYTKEVKYKEWNNPQGPVFVLTADEIRKIEFSNGTVKTYAPVAASPVNAPAPQNEARKPIGNGLKVTKESLPAGFQFNLDVEGNLSFQSARSVEGWYMDAYACGGVSVTLGAGARLGKFLYVGAASGVLGEWGATNVREGQDGSKEKMKAAAYVVPIFADTRIYAPTSGNCYPFAEIGIGGYVGIDGLVKGADEKESSTPAGGFYFVSGAGLEFKYLTLGIGYKLLRTTEMIGNHGYVKVGVSLGRNQKIRQ